MDDINEGQDSDGLSVHVQSITVSLNQQTLFNKIKELINNAIEFAYSLSKFQQYAAQICQMNKIIFVS